MRKFLLSTELTCDLSKEVIEKYDINILDMEYSVNGKEYSSKDGLTSKEFCDMMRKGAITKTASVNEFDATNYFTNLLKQGKDILHIAFTSGMSGSYYNIEKVVNELNEKNQNKIYLSDSLCACTGQGFLTVLASEFAGETKTAKQTLEYVEKTKLKINHIFTVDDLKYLVRGGRVSKAKATVGAIMNIKPVLNVNDEGKIVQLKNVISRKKSIITMAEMVKQKFNGEVKKVFISHADCLDDALLLKKYILEKLDVDIEIYELGFVICSHSGPGTLSVYFIGDKR